MNPARRFNATCRHCRCALFTTARIGNGELGRLREHVHQVHPHVALPADAAAGAIVAHFDVSPAP